MKGIREDDKTTTKTTTKRRRSSTTTDEEGIRNYELGRTMKRRRSSTTLLRNEVELQRKTMKLNFNDGRSVKISLQSV